MADWADRIIPPPDERTFHVCIDMQRLFGADGPWPTPWMDRVLPAVLKVAAHAPERTVFTRFMPPAQAEDMHGTWRAYYEHWRELTREEIDPALLELMPPLLRFVPPATVVDKPIYSAFGPSLVRLLAERQASGVIVSGGETDVCVLATILDAVDLGYRTYVVADALCSSSDPGHDAVLTLLNGRYSQQIAVMNVEALCSLWPR